MIETLRPFKINEMLADQNDINEDTRMQLELINEAMAELQVRHKINSQRPQIGLSLQTRKGVKGAYYNLTFRVVRFRVDISQHSEIFK